MKIKITLISITLAFCINSLFADSNYGAYKDYIKGMLEYKSGKVESAKKDLEKVVKADDSALSVYKELTYMYLQTNDKEKALKTAEKVSVLDSKSSSTTAFLGRFYSDISDQENAKKYWEETLKIDPYNEPAMIYMAVYYFSDDKMKESEKYWDKYLQQQPDSAAGYMQLGLVQERLGKADAALKTFDKVISLQSNFVDAYTAKARVYESKGNFKLAKKEYEKALDLLPGNPYILVFLGRTYIETKEYDKAIEVFQKAKKAEQLDVKRTSIFWLGVIYETHWQIDKAVKEFEELAKIEENNMAVYGKLGYFYSLLKEYSKSEKNFKKALSINPVNHEVLYMMALNYLDWGKYDKSIECLNKAIEQKPDFTDAYFFLGSAYDKKNDFVNMEKAFFRVLELDQNNARTLNYLAFIYAEKNINLDKAQEYAEKAINLEPANGSFLDSLGWVYYKQGKYELAAAVLLKASNYTRDALVYNHLGNAYTALGRGSESWVAFALSYDIKADTEVRKKLDEIEKIMPKEEFFKQMLLRSESNYLRVFSLKGGYTVKLNSGFFSSKAYVPFYFVRNEGMRIEIPQKFVLGGANVYIKGGSVSYEPKAIKDSILENFNELIEFLSEIINTDFLKQFGVGSMAEVKDKKVVYTKGDYEIILNAQTAQIEKITKNGTSIELLDYTDFFNSKLPSKIKINSKSLKINGTFDASKFQLAEKNSAVNKTDIKK